MAGETHLPAYMDELFAYSRRMVSGTTKDDELDPPASSASVLAENLRRLMAAHPELNSNPKLGKKTGLGASAVSRLINGHNSTVGTLDKLASAFRLESWHLLMPYLDPHDPPPRKSLSERETRLYQRFKEIALEAIKG